MDMQIIMDIKVTKVVSMVSNGSNDVKQALYMPKGLLGKGFIEEYSAKSLRVFEVHRT